MRAPFRTKFDPDKDFAVRRRFTVGGQSFYPGDAFDKTLVNTRRLRQLFDQRTLIHVGETPGQIIRPDEAEAPKEKTKGKTAPADASQDPGEIARGDVEIPEDWASLPWPQRLSLASKLTDEKVHNGPEAAAAIEAELARRAEAP